MAATREGLLGKMGSALHLAAVHHLSTQEKEKLLDQFQASSGELTQSDPAEFVAKLTELATEMKRALNKHGTGALLTSVLAMMEAFNAESDQAKKIEILNEHVRALKDSPVKKQLKILNDAVEIYTKWFATVESPPTPEPPRPALSQPFEEVPPPPAVVQPVVAQPVVAQPVVVPPVVVATAPVVQRSYANLSETIKALRDKITLIADLKYANALRQLVNTLESDAIDDPSNTRTILQIANSALDFTMSIDEAGSDRVKVVKSCLAFRDKAEQTADWARYGNLINGLIVAVAGLLLLAATIAACVPGPQSLFVPAAIAAVPALMTGGLVTVGLFGKRENWFNKQVGVVNALDIEKVRAPTVANN